MPDRLQLQVLLAVGGGGFIGASLRYLLNGAFLVVTGGLPWGTLIANVSGSFALALFTGWGGHRAMPDPRLRGFIAAGLLGGYTTFATFANENILLLHNGQAAALLVYLLLTNTLCLLAAVAGLTAGRRL